MKYAHTLKLTVFSYENEDSEKVLEAFLNFFPFSLEENRIALKKTNATGFNESKIEILEATLARHNLISQFLENLRNKLDEEQRNLLISQAESRLDENLDFFIRFDKGEWINERKLLLTDSGKCFHIRMGIAAFPKKREIALKAIHNLFSSQ